MTITPSPGNSIALVLRYRNEIGKLSALTGIIAKQGGSIGAIDVVKSDRTHITRKIVVDTTGEDHAKAITHAVKAMPGVELVDAYDCTFKLHEGGKLDVVSKTPLRNYVDLSMAYTPGVARICQAVHKDVSAARKYTIRRNTVGIVTDGSAVLGLGDIGAVAALPVMEGKAVLFKEFGGVNAFPVCLDVDNLESLLECAKAVSATFGGINLEDIAAPECFEIERRLTEAVDIPVFHDDQHGTAVVIGAAFINAARITGKDPSKMLAVISGAGAAGIACTRALLDLGVGDIVVSDRKGAIYEGREVLNASKEWLARTTNKQNRKGSLKEVLAGADLFLGVSGPHILSGDDIRKMSPDPIVFALSNPTPEVPPEEIADYAAVVATGRSDYPNQINNVLCFPGLFRGLLESGVKRVTREMLTAAAKAIAGVIPPDEVRPDYIIPSAFNDKVGPAVADAVMQVAGDSSASRTSIYFEF
ncbi:MAG: malate dehydrogenase [Armatimonadetes bacterium RBG_16_58_9]|nr:MAG: malate dehydrogenase [Armatimonadetes bacterium RBG_16_58_9]